MALDKFGDIPITSGADKQKGSRLKKTSAGLPDQCVSSAGLDETRIVQDDITLAGVEKRPLKKEPPSGKKKKMFKSLRWGFVLAAFVVLYGITSYFLVPALVQKSLVPLVSKRLDRPVEIKRIVFSPFSLQLFLTDIRIGNVHGDLQGTGNLLTSSTLRCRLGIDRIFEGKLTCEEIVLEDVHVQISREKTSFSDLADIMNIFSLQFNDAADQVWPLWLDAGELTLSRGTITFNDILRNKQYRVDQVELYFPGFNADRDTEARLPQLSAVVNSSPVQAEAVRVLNNNGKLETGIDLHIKDIFLPGYLDYLPIDISQYRLSEGTADIDLRVVFPTDQGSSNKIALSGESFVSGVRIVDSEEKTVMTVSETRFGFTFLPMTGQYRILNMVVSQPEIDIYSGRTVQKKHPGITPADIAVFMATVILSPSRVRIEQMRGDSGKIRFYFPDSSQQSIIWDDVTFKLNNFETPGWAEVENGTRKNKGSKPAYFALNVSDKSGSRGMNASVEGQIHPGRGIGGRFTMTRLDLARYGVLLPTVSPRFEKGIGDIRFTYDFVPGGPGHDNKGAYSFLLGDGYLDVSDYTLQVESNNIKSLSGSSLKCDGLQVDPSLKKMTCNSLEIVGSEIFTVSAKSAKQERIPAGQNDWQAEVIALNIDDSRLHTSFLKDICTGAQDLVLNNLTVTADHLNSLQVDKKISVTATVGAKGSIRLGSEKSVNDRPGEEKIQVDLQNIDFRYFRPCISKTFIPAVQQGELNARGSFSRSSGEFIGTMSINNLVAGSTKGPYISWQKGSTKKGKLRVAPPALNLGDVTIIKPVVVPGLMDSDIPLDNFLQPDKFFFEKPGIDTLTVKEGRFRMPWPIILPGYQPELVELSGTLISPGPGPMEFDLNGKADGFASFGVKGIVSKSGISEYSLETKDMDFTLFTSFVQKELGLVPGALQGEWYQESTTSAQTVTRLNRISLQGIVPEADAPLAKVLALLVDENNELVVEIEDTSSPPESQQFLLPAIQRYLQHQAVRADISEQLILQEFLPDLQTVSLVLFEPGSSVLRDPSVLGGYRQLVDKRPLLGVLLQPFIDEVSDRSALREILQQEADMKRDEKNRNRAIARQKLLAEQKKMIGELKEGKAAVVTEEISYDELILDLEPLSPVQVDVPSSMLAELAEERATAVYDYLVNSLSIAPGRVVVEKQYRKGFRQVRITPVPRRKTITVRGVEDGNS